jgi:hypothetical protein
LRFGLSEISPRSLLCDCAPREHQQLCVGRPGTCAVDLFSEGANDAILRSLPEALRGSPSSVSVPFAANGRPLSRSSMAQGDETMPFLGGWAPSACDF